MSNKDEDLLKGFDPKTVYAIKKLQARYPHAKDVLSALLADVEKNELDGDNADAEHMKQIKRIEQKLHDIIKKNDLSEAHGDTDFGMFSKEGNAQVENIIQYILNDFDDKAEKATNSQRDALRMEALKRLFSELEDLGEDPKHEEATDTDVRERSAAYLDKGIIRLLNRLDGVPVESVYESVKVNDLRELVVNEISIDQYKSKLGKDDKIIVMAIKVKDKEPAHDLSQFIESALIEDVLDVDVSPGPNEDGEYTVFVEMPRHENAYSVVEKIINDIKTVDNNFESPMFKAYENKELQELTQDNFKASVITNAVDYQLRHDTDAKQIAERMKFLVKY